MKQMLNSRHMLRINLRKGQVAGGNRILVILEKGKTIAEKKKKELCRSGGVCN